MFQNGQNDTLPISKIMPQRGFRGVRGDGELSQRRSPQIVCKGEFGQSIQERGAFDFKIVISDTNGPRHVLCSLRGLFSCGTG
jgi:hypothetical protein